jgi:hypothetical protein
VAPEHRPVGGLGLVLIAGMSSSAKYCRLPGGNRITLVVTTPIAPA